LARGEPLRPVLLLLIVLLVVTAALTVSQDRYRQSLTAPLAPFAGWVLALLAGSRGGRPRLLWPTLAACAAFLSATMLLLPAPTGR
jgi:hypothetical protein